MLLSEILRIKGNVLFTTTPDGTVFDAVRVMADHNVGSLVVMARGRVAGMLTFREVLVAVVRGGGALGAQRVDEVYERDPLIVPAGLDIMELRGRMLERRARYVPVVDGDTLLGIVSFHDVAKAVYEEQSFENRMLKSYIEDSPPAIAR
jgi:CBS domain-containing protein